jgi:uncharacterized protein (TIGR02284 family)
MSTQASEVPATGKVIEMLNRLIQTCTDGEKGYAIAAADVREPNLKGLLFGYAKQRADFVAELQDAIAARGSLPENEGTARGTLHRGWVDVRLAVEGRTDAAVLEECLRGENAAKKSYEAAIASLSLDLLPSDVRRIVALQYTAVVQAGGEIAQRLRSAKPVTAKA